MFVMVFFAQYVTIINPLDSPNTDGIDPDSTNNAVILDSYFFVGDDGIAIKSGWDTAGYTYGVPTTNVYVRNLTVINDGSCGVCIGSEMSGGVANVTVEHSQFYTSEGIRMKSAQGRGGYVVNVTYNDIVMEWQGIAISLNDYYGDHPVVGYNASALPIVHDFYVKNVVAKNVWQAFDFSGLGDSPFYNIFLSNVTVKAVVGWTCGNVTGYAHEVLPSPPCPQFKVN